jgi:predicted transcriptional regulator
MDQPTVRINPETGEPEVATFQAFDQAQHEQELNDAQARFDSLEQEVAQLDEARGNTQAALDQIDADRAAKVTEKDAAEEALLNYKSRDEAIAHARELYEQQLQSGELTPASEADGDGDTESDDAPSSSVEAVDVPVNIAPSSAA